MFGSPFVPGPSRVVPLAGVVVADFSRVLAGPLATMFLADLGATVIKVERPGRGDDTRAWGPPFIGEMSTYFTSVNRNKRSIVLDLREDGDLQLARTLLARSDVMVQNLLPGKLDKYKLDADSVLAANPRLVYCSISGFGAAGGAQLPGYDFVVQAVGGLMSITGAPDGEPTKVGVALVDVLTGLHATIGILAALRERDASGHGQHVEVNLLSSLLSSLVNQGAGYLNGGPIPVPMGNQHPSIAPYETLAASDSQLAIAVGSDTQFAAFANAVERPDLPADPRFATNAMRVIHRGELASQIEDALADDTAAHWTRRLHASGIACGPINNIAEALDLASRLGLDPIVTFEPEDGSVGVATLASPLRLSQTPIRYDKPPPALGADTAELRGWLLSSSGRPLT